MTAERNNLNNSANDHDARSDEDRIASPEALAEEHGRKRTSETSELVNGGHRSLHGGRFGVISLGRRKLVVELLSGDLFLLSTLDTTAMIS